MRNDIEIRRLKKRIRNLERESRSQDRIIRNMQNTYNRRIESLEVNNFMLTSEVNGLRVRENSRSKDKVTAVLLAGAGTLICLIALAKRK